MHTISSVICFMALSIATLSFAQSGTDSPGAMAQEVLTILQKLDQLNEEEYEAYFLSFDTYAKMSVDEALDENIRKELARITEEEFHKHYSENRRELMHATERLNGKRSDLSYDTAVYELKVEGGLKGVEGKLYFLSGEKRYSIQYMGIVRQGKHYLVSIDRLRNELTRAEEAMITEETIGTDAVESTAPVVKEQVVLESGNRVEEFPDFLAEFPGGPRAMQQFILNNVIYPEEAAMNGEEGKVYLTFVVNADGRISNVSVVRGVSELIDAEAIRLIRKMPNWYPAEKGGKAVPTLVTIPIDFQLD